VPLPNCHFYSKLEGDAIYTSCFLGCTQHPDKVFTNFNHLSTCFADEGVLKPGACHLPIVIEICYALRNSNSVVIKSYHEYFNH
jgi:hypothetical protein